VSINFSEDPKFEVSQKTLQFVVDLFLADRKTDGYNKPISVLLNFYKRYKDLVGSYGV